MLTICPTRPELQRKNCWKCCHTNGRLAIPMPSSPKRNNRQVQYYNDSGYIQIMIVAAAVIVCS